MRLKLDQHKICIGVFPLKSLFWEVIPVNSYHNHVREIVGRF